MQLFWRNQAHPFTSDKAGYHAYQTHQQIQDILDEAVNKKRSIYVYWVFTSTAIVKLVQSDAQIRCVSPESIARYSDEPIWVMGIGEWSWAKPKKASYLTVEQMGQADLEDHCRRAFGHWALTHPVLLGASYAASIDGKQNFPLEGMPVTSEPIQSSQSTQDVYHRMASTDFSPLAFPKSSPSKLQQYQKCPYSYYLQHVLGIKNTAEKQTDSQVMGILIHEAIEQMIKENGATSRDLSLHLSQTMTPLIAESLKNEFKINGR